MLKNSAGMPLEKENLKDSALWEYKTKIYSSISYLSWSMLFCTIKSNVLTKEELKRSFLMLSLVKANKFLIKHLNRLLSFEYKSWNSFINDFVAALTTDSVNAPTLNIKPKRSSVWRLSIIMAFETIGNVFEGKFHSISNVREYINGLNMFKSCFE